MKLKGLDFARGKDLLDGCVQGREDVGRQYFVQATTQQIIGREDEQMGIRRVNGLVGQIFVDDKHQIGQSLNQRGLLGLVAAQGFIAVGQVLGADSYLFFQALAVLFQFLA